jgi:CHRD domain-containing protein
VRKLWLSAVLGLLLLAFVVVSVATADRGGGDQLRAKLHGFTEVPAVSTAAQGRFQARIDGDEIHYKLRYADLEAPIRFAHIHFGQEAVSGGVAAFLCGGGSKPACPQSGEVSGTIVASDVEGPAAQGIAPGEIDELIEAMESGVTYANVHSDKFPSGEIRGQIEGVDEDD